MNSEVDFPILDQVPLLEGVKAILENSHFDLTPVSEEHNQGLAVPVDFVAISNGIRFVVKCLPNPEAFEESALLALVEFSRGHGINEVMLIGNGEFSPTLIASANVHSVRLTNRASYRQALQRLPGQLLENIKTAPEEKASTAEIPLQNFAPKSAFETPSKPDGGMRAEPPPLPRGTGVGHSAPPSVGGTGSISTTSEMHLMESDLRGAVPPRGKKKRSIAARIGRSVLVVFLLLVIWVGYSASKKGIDQLSSQGGQGAEAPALSEVGSVKKIIEDTILETRKTSGLTTIPFDAELIGYLEPQARVLTFGGQLPTPQKLEDMLGNVDPGFRIGSSTVFVADKPEELATQVKRWSPLVERPNDEFGSLSQLGNDGKIWTWVYHGNRITRKEQLDEALKHGGGFILKCGHCGKDSGYKLTAHAKFFVKPDCSHCGLTSHAFGPNTEGDYLRACDFLTGFKIPEKDVAKFLPENPEARTPRAEILAHWSAILDRCDYEFDTRQKGESRRDVWKLPQQTWDERVGDCEDTSILLADALISAGYDARVALGQWEGGGHAWCVVKADGRQWILETTQPMTGAASLRSIIKVGGDYVAMCTFNRDSIFLRRHAANLSTPDYFSDNYWLTLNLKEVEGERGEGVETALRSETVQ